MREELLSAVKTLCSAIAGSALEWFDFALFGLFAPEISANFFTGDQPDLKLLKVGDSQPGP